MIAHRCRQMISRVHATKSVTALPKASSSARTAPAALESRSGTVASNVRDPTILPFSPRIFAAN